MGLNYQCMDELEKKLKWVISNNSDFRTQPTDLTIYAGLVMNAGKYSVSPLICVFRFSI